MHFFQCLPARMCVQLCVFCWTFRHDSGNPAINVPTNVRVPTKLGGGCARWVGAGGGVVRLALNANWYNLGAPWNCSWRWATGDGKWALGNGNRTTAGGPLRTLCVNLWTNLCATTDVNVSRATGRGLGRRWVHCLPVSI